MRYCGGVDGATELPREPGRLIAAPNAKLAALAASGTLNRDPQTVRDPLFRGGGFFDPRDLLQLRYEMIRRHRIENLSVAVTDMPVSASSTATSGQQVSQNGKLGGSSVATG